ncbi:unnamed protein product [[Candida] boidinii]|uniref:Unnamed protein product n=1 Tax=Candida boidinii TaxID=5477 RepID=A0A9W6T2K7_CANBO|nr:unnamed protein product [[Candida] boidinii]
MRQLESYENYMSSAQAKNKIYDNDERNIQYSNEKFNTPSLFATEPQSNPQTFFSSSGSQMSQGGGPLSNFQTPQPPVPYTANNPHSQLPFSPPLQQYYPEFNGPQNVIPIQQNISVQTFNQQSQQQQHTQLQSQVFVDSNQKQFQHNQQQPQQHPVATPMANIFTPPQVIFTPPNMNSNSTPSNVTPPNYVALQHDLTNKVTNVATTQSYTPSPQIQQIQGLVYPDSLFPVPDPTVNMNAKYNSNSNTNSN